MAELSLDDQVALVCSSSVSLRSRVLELTPAPEEVIPLLPDAELCFTVKALGLWDASWILEHATATQLVASLDLDVWRGAVPNAENLRSWIAALAHAGGETLLRTAQCLDSELLVLMLRDRVHVMLDPKDDEWQPPEGARTLDGVFYLLARRSADDLADLIALLQVVFSEDYWLYFRLLQGVIWELESDLQEWALRWRDGRLQDLGFPAADDAMRIYGYLRPEERDLIPDAGRPLDVVEWQLPIFLPELPAALERTHSVLRAAADLDDEQRHGFFYAFVATANKVAVADGMPLSESETLPDAIEAAASVLSAGLEHLAVANGLGLTDVLRRVSLERLFRVGASLQGRKPQTTRYSVDTYDEAGEDAEASNNGDLH